MPWADTPRPSRSPPQPGDRGEAAGRDHPDVARSLHNLAALHAAQGRWAEAAESFDRARRVVRRHIGRVLPALAEAEQLTFLKANDEGELHMALALAVARRDDPEAVGRSAGWVLNGKAVAQEALAQRALLARDRDDPAAAQLAAVRNQLAALTLASPKPGQEEERLRAIDRLTARAGAVQATGSKRWPARPR